MPDHIPGRTWTDRPGGNSLVVEQTSPGDPVVEIWTGHDDGKSVLLTEDQLCDLIGDLTARYHLIQGRRARWPQVHNEIHGHVTGPVIQTGHVSGDVHLGGSR